MEKKKSRMVDTGNLTETETIRVTKRTKPVFEYAKSWDNETVKRDKEVGRNDGIYPDTVLWGMAINRTMNPSFGFLMQEICRALNVDVLVNIGMEAQQLHDKYQTHGLRPEETERLLHLKKEYERLSGRRLELLK